MSDNSKNNLTPEERRRRAELKKRRQREQRRRAKRRKILTALVVIATVIILILLGFILYKLIGSGGEKISAQGDTYVIALDPGHGGDDVGVSSDTSSYEKDIDLAICEKLKVMLESQGYTVVMLRDDDSYISKDERVVLANKSGADLLVSVHCNYSDSDATLTGITTTYTKGDRAAKTLAENILERTAAESGAEALGAEAGEYTILEDTDMTAVLIEVGYLSNSSEAADLDDDSYRNDIAKGIAYGILDSLKD